MLPWKLSRGAARAMVMAGLFGLASCAASLNVGETHVGKQELYKTGNLDYDEFFEDVYNLQQKAKSIDSDEKKARAPLGQHFGAPDAPVPDLVHKLKGRAEDLAQGKGKVHFALEGLDEQGQPLAGKSIEVRSASKGRALPRDAVELASAIEDTARAEGQLWEKYGPVAEKSHRMNDRVQVLHEQVDKDYVSKEKRQEVRRELGAAKVVVGEIGGRADKVVASALQFLHETGDAFTAAAEVKAAEPKKDKKAEPARGSPRKAPPKEPRTASAARPQGEKPEGSPKPTAVHAEGSPKPATVHAEPTEPERAPKPEAPPPPAPAPAAAPAQPDFNP
jgi:hypothetical protein